MHVQYVALCDQVIISADGKSSLIGVFDHVVAESVPLTLPRVAFAGRILFTTDEVGRKYQVNVKITDPNGVELGTPGGEIDLPTAPPGVDSLAVDVPMVFDLFGIGAYGRYSFVLQVDGKAVAGAQLTVRKAPLMS